MDQHGLSLLLRRTFLILLGAERLTTAAIRQAVCEKAPSSGEAF